MGRVAGGLDVRKRHPPCEGDRRPNQSGAVQKVTQQTISLSRVLVLPAALDIAPNLVPLAAVGLVMIMVGAAITRTRRHEFKLMVADLVHLAVAGFVAWGRFGPESFAS